MQQRLDPPAYATFQVRNWFQWIIDARKMGYSNDDIRWILRTIGIWDEIERRVKAWDEPEKEQAP
jgi:hypothetical protein